MTLLRDDAIDPAAVAARVAGVSSGGVVTFVGTVRDHSGGRAVERLEYSAYPAMADVECDRIIAETLARWPVAVALEHRIGELWPGDVAIVVATAAAHRADAFESCRFVVDSVKARVPIWKREYFADGSDVWVDPTSPPAAPAT